MSDSVALYDPYNMVRGPLGPSIGTWNRLRLSARRHPYSKPSIVLDQPNYAEPSLERFSSSADNCPPMDTITHHCTGLRHPIVGLNITHSPSQVMRKLLTRHLGQPSNYSIRKWINLSKSSRINAPNQTIPLLSTAGGSLSTKFWRQVMSLTSPSPVCNLHIYLHSNSLRHLHF